MTSSFEKPWLICAEVAPILRAMAEDPRLGYRYAAQVVTRGLQDRTLAGIQGASTRYWIALRAWRARPAKPASGAIFQCLPRAYPPRSDKDWVGWIVVQEGYRSGALVLAHEINHFQNRHRAWQLADQTPPLADPSLGQGIAPEALRAIRARLVNEIAARHFAWLAEEGIVPGTTPLPDPGALLACAVKIASYPEVYADTQFMPKLLARSDPDLLRDQVGLWFPALRDFVFFGPETEVATPHARYLDKEIAVAALGRRAPILPAEGTL